ncbi:unnamed protein product [Coffea canephora]|uniref:Uncharacterized protein n=1 Tax=Coffea canephora TaxID=49390 RepID=A0A068VAK6_COFCA|nr:unnamed protein product [Coffea canephora]
MDMQCIAMIDVANEFETLVDDNNQDVTRYKDLENEVSVSTHINPVLGKQFPTSVFDKEGASLKLTRILINTFLDLESYAMKFLESNEKILAVYPVGPLINFNDMGDANETFKSANKELNQRSSLPNHSIIFLCFGNLGYFCGYQVKEIAHAIEHTGCRFLWSS